MKCRLTYILALTLNLTALAAAQHPNTGGSSTYSPSDVVPAIVSTSAASFRAEALARGSIAVVFGTGVATQTVIAATVPLPKTLGGVTVKINGIDAPLFFVSPNQINYLVPDNLPDGEAEMIISNDAVGQTHKGVLSVAAVSPGIFTANASGRGAPSATALRIRPNGTQNFESITRFDANTGSNVLTPIDLGSSDERVFLTLFGTGWKNRISEQNTVVYIGGVRVEVLYIGTQGVFVGVDQINALIPRSLAGRGIVEVLVVVDGKIANTVDIWIK